MSAPLTGQGPQPAMPAASADRARQMRRAATGLLLLLAYVGRYLPLGVRATLDHPLLELQRQQLQQLLRL